MKYEKKIRIINPETWNHHRHGWKEVVSKIKYYLENDNGIELHTNIESESINNVTIKNPWIGIIHNVPKHPDYVMEYYNIDCSNEIFFSSHTWQSSKNKCKGLITFSNYSKNFIKAQTSTPVCNLFHPTENSVEKFNWNNFEKNKDKKIIMIGHWLRNFYTLEKIKSNILKVCLLKGGDFIYEKLKLNNIFFLERIDNTAYDDLLSNNIVFLDLFDSSANNVIIECIQRNTPIIVNKLEAVVEYLGENYPLYFNNLNEINILSNNFDKLYQGYIYLKNLDKTFLSYDHFIESLANCSIYKSIKLAKYL